VLPRERISRALARPADGSTTPALVAYMTAGFPTRAAFLPTLRAIASEADAVEIGVPFSDPMADGVTIQRASQRAIEQGASLTWIFDELARRDFEIAAPLLFMSYLNPLLAFGFDRLAARAAEVGAGGFIVPDLPFEESAPLHAALGPHGLALVQLVTPATPVARLQTLGAATEGFLYAVTRTGITGGEAALPAELAQYLAAVKKAATLPVCAGFGVRSADQVALIGRHADGVIVGSALVEVLERGEDPAEFLRSLRPRRSTG
jgi:tryptophan synthase alpha chain